MAALTTKTLRPAGEGREPKDEWENDKIIRAVRNGDINTLVSMSHQGIDVTTARDQLLGRTVLHEASKHGHHELLQHLQTTGIAVDVRNDYQWTALHNAALNGNNVCVLLLCSSGAAVDAKTNDGETPLHKAAHYGHNKAIEILMAAGATVDVKDNGGSTPLHKAAYDGHNKAIDILMAAGAKVDVKSDFGDTPLAVAVNRGHAEAVHTLLYKYKADPSRVMQRLQQQMKDLLKEAEEKIQNSTNETSSSSHDPQQEKKSLTTDQEKRAFQLAMRDGVANSLSFRLCVFGPENSGKTCLVDTLFDDIFQQQVATQGADVHICTIYATNWQKCSPAKMAENIQNQFFHDLNISAMEQANLPSFQASIGARRTGFVSKFKAVLFRSQPTALSQPHKAPEVKPEEMKRAKAITIISENEFTAIVWDFAGQIQYLSTHTVFIRRNNVVFIVFKASCHLSDLIKPRPGDEDTASSSKPTTYFHVIHYWLQTVTSVCHDTGGPDHLAEFLPVAVLIATHIDEITGDLEEAKEAIITQLAKELEGKPYAKHLAGNFPGVGLLNALRKFCFFLSNKFRDDNTITQLKEIVLQISAPRMKERHPLIYLKIEKELLLLGKEVITTTEFHKVAVENGFMAKENSMEMKGALNHFHQKGVILHFPSIDNLKELVFLSPQWLEKLIAFLIIAHHYKPTGDTDDHSYRRLKHEGVLVGSFLYNSLQMFNKLHRVIGCEISFDQAIAFLVNFCFIAEISITTVFLEECHPWSEEEKRIFIVPSQLPEDKEEKRLTFIKEKYVWSIYFAFTDGFIPLTIFHQMIAACINWNESKKQNIAWLKKYEIMMVLNHGQYYSVSLCEAKSSIQVDIILEHSMERSAENRKQLIDLFQTTLEKICHDLIPASSKPVPYIQCPHCNKVHLKLRNLLEGRAQLCDMKSIPQEYYQDLFREFNFTVTSKTEQPVKGSAACVGVVASNGQTYNCSDAAKLLKSKFALLSNLSYPNMSGSLYANNVITQQEKLEIDQMVGKSQMERVLDIVIASLKANQTAKYKGFLLTMESNEDGTLNAKAQELGGSHSVPG